MLAVSAYYTEMFTACKEARFQSFPQQIVSACSHTYRNKAEKVLSNRLVFSAKFPEIFRFYGYPVLLHLRKINRDNSLSIIWGPCAAE